MKRGLSARCLIIAEAGVNHNGRISLAKKMVSAAARAGADFIKFQTFEPSALATNTAPKVEYQKRTTGQKGNQVELLKKLQLSRADFISLKKECKKQKIGFLSTAFDLESLCFVESLNPAFHKISSGDIDNLPFLQKVASFGRPLLLSTGMATMKEVGDAIRTIIRAGLAKRKIFVLQCHTDYPSQAADVNLRAMNAMQQKFRVRTGFSDHTQGIAIAFAAVALGATVLEKHFTLNRSMKGPDHQSSLNPKELDRLVIGIREVEAALGDGVKRPSRAEKKIMRYVRKKIVAFRTIKKGEIFTRYNLGCKRCKGEVPAGKFRKILGKKSPRAYLENEAIRL